MENYPKLSSLVTVPPPCMELSCIHNTVNHNLTHLRFVVVFDLGPFGLSLIWPNGLFTVI